MNALETKLGQVLETVNLYGAANALSLAAHPERARPDFIVDDLNDFRGHPVLSPNCIWANFDLIIFDIDGTLTAEGAAEIHPGILATFQQIKSTRIAMACLTNKVSDRNLVLQLREGIKVMSGVQKKPHPSGYRAILQNYPVADPGRVLFVGDSLSTDIAGAKALGMKTVLVDHRKLFDGPDKLLTKRFFGRPFDRVLLGRIAELDDTTEETRLSIKRLLSRHD